MTTPKRSSSWEGFGEYLRTQRQLAQLTLRQLAELTTISNPYLSQLERGLHQPSIAVLKSIADALNLSVEALLEHAGVVGGDSKTSAVTTETAIRNDPVLNASQKAALLSVYRSMIEERGARPGASPVAAVEDADAPVVDAPSTRHTA